MSGIAGSCRASPEGARRWIDQMQEALSHRGVDGCSIWQNAGTTLLHCAFHTTPEARLEKQPFTDGAAGLTIVGDIRLDNRDEIAEALGLGREASSMGDAELVLRAFQRWGERCPERLLGDFAFAVWEQSPERLFLARDPTGVRPLYYHHGPGGFAFASEVRALAGLEGFRRVPDERKVADYLLSLPDERERTFFRAIKRLLPACGLVFTAGRIRVREYWRPDPYREIRLTGDAEYGEALRVELDRAVECRTRAVGPCTATLSGGLDSSSVACLAARRLRAAGAEPLRTIAAVFGDLPDCDERDYQRAVVESYGTQHLETRPLDCRTSEDLDRLLYLFHEPEKLGLHWTMWSIMERASGSDSRVLLTGLPGDQVVSHGWGWPAELAGQRRWIELTRECWTGWRGGYRTARGVASGIVRAYLPDRPLASLDGLRGRLAEPWRLAQSVVRPELIRNTGAESRVSLTGTDPQFGRTSRLAHYERLMGPQTLGDIEFTEPCAARFSLEVRHPFFDRRVVELCLAFPGDQKRRRGVTRYALRTAMRGILPELVRGRLTKATFGFSERHGGKNILRQHAKNFWNVDGLEHYIDPLAGRDLYYRVLNAGPELPRFVWVVAWRCAMLGEWLRRIGASPRAAGERSLSPQATEYDR